MAGLEKKWKDLWKAFEATRKSEWLKAQEVGNFNAMIKEAPAMGKILKALDEGEGVVLDACGNRGGKTYKDVAPELKSWVSKMNVLKKGTLKTLARASFNDMDKATKPNTYRALKVLMTGIDEITSLAEYTHKALVDAAASAGKEVSSQERVAKVQALALAQVKKAVMKSLAEIQKVKAKPTPQTWTDLIGNGGTRDLCMGLTTLHGAQQKGNFGDVPAALGHKNAAQPFNTGQPMAVLGANDDANEVTRRLKAWSQVVKAVATDYQAHW